MMRRFLLLSCLLTGVLISSVWLVGAQDVSPSGDPEDPFLQITMPLAVSVLTGEVDIMGSADAIDMANYFIEYRPLMLDANGNFVNDDDESQSVWSPAAFPEVAAVQDGILGVWDTTRVEDGLYEIRLTANITGSTPQFFRVSPLRVDNTLLPEDENADSADASDDSSTSETEDSSSAPAANTATAIVNANVRTGDNTGYGRIGSLLNGETVEVLGISNTGSGWLYVRLSNGREGFVAPSVVNVSGDTSTLSRIAPPPSPSSSSGSSSASPTSTPTSNGTMMPTSTATATSNGTMMPTSTATATSNSTMMPTSTATSNSTMMPTSTMQPTMTSTP
ncbi:MAG: SH3 domain-containing protein [Aggregatilineales bacterium]